MAGRATLAGSGAIVLWSLLAFLTRAADLPPFELAAISFGVSGGLGLAWLIVRGQMATLRQPPLAWLHGVGGLFGYHALYFAALGLAPAADANLINYLWPLLIVVLSATLLHLPLRPRHLVGVVLAAAGCIVLLGGRAAFPPGAWAGYGLAALSALTWALYSVLARRLAAVPSEAVLGFCAATALLAALVHVLFERTVWPTPSSLGAAMLMGLGPVGAAFLLWDIGMKRGDPRRLGIFAFATPVLSTLVLVAAGYAPFAPALLLAAALVAAGGFLAGR